MKKILFAMLLAVVSLSANAQFERNTTYFNASLSGLNLSYSKLTDFQMGFQATGGYFVEDGWMVLGQLGYNHAGGDHFSVGAAGRYYFYQNGIYLNLGVKYQHTCPNINSVYLTPEVGYCFYLNNHVSIEPAVYYDMCLNKFADRSTVGLKLGFGYYF